MSDREIAFYRSLLADILPAPAPPPEPVMVLVDDEARDRAVRPEVSLLDVTLGSNAAGIPAADLGRGIAARTVRHGQARVPMPDPRWFGAAGDAAWGKRARVLALGKRLGGTAGAAAGALAGPLARELALQIHMNRTSGRLTPGGPHSRFRGTGEFMGHREGDVSLGEFLDTLDRRDLDGVGTLPAADVVAGPVESYEERLPQAQVQAGPPSVGFTMGDLLGEIAKIRAARAAEGR